MLRTKNKNHLKIILIGPAGIGKTTIKKMFFESANPLDNLSSILEPTIGVEINEYSQENSILIYDLAGQELNRWLYEESELFFQTEIIICMLDSKEIWNKNVELIERIINLKQLYCQNAKIAYFIHKIDLLNETQLDELDKNFKDLIKFQTYAVFFQTSITPKYFLDTYKIFISLLQKYFDVKDLVKINEFLIKMSILDILLHNKELSIDEIGYKLYLDKKYLEKIMKEFIEKGYIEEICQKTKLHITSEGAIYIQEYRQRVIQELRH